MECLAVPWLFVGPAGSGKLMEARSLLENAHATRLPIPLDTKILPVGDGYEARIFTSPYHFEIDIPTLSMQDKQIIGDLLTTFFSSTDVFHALRSSVRKLVVLRRAHSLSLPAAVRVRAILQQYVFPPDAVGMIWMTAREITGPLTLLMDGFCVRRIPRMSFEAWRSAAPEVYRTREAYEACEGRVERSEALARHFPSGTPVYPRRLQEYYDELLRTMVLHARSGIPPTLAVVTWIRACVYQLLSFCQTGPEIIDSCAAAVERAVCSEKSPLHESDILWTLMDTFTVAESHTSYRTPLALEMMLLRLYDVLRARLPVVRLAPAEVAAPVVRAAKKTAAAGAKAAGAKAAAAPAKARRRKNEVVFPSSSSTT